jgi:hypothetical protein
MFGETSFIFQSYNAPRLVPVVRGEAQPLLELVEPSGRRFLWVLIELYRRLLERVERVPHGGTLIGLVAWGLNPSA